VAAAAGADSKPVVTGLPTSWPQAALSAELSMLASKFRNNELCRVCTTTRTLANPKTKLLMIFLFRMKNIIIH
jgi:hypothetical protein